MKVIFSCLIALSVMACLVETANAAIVVTATITPGANGIVTDVSFTGIAANDVHHVSIEFFEIVGGNYNLVEATDWTDTTVPPQNKFSNLSDPKKFKKGAQYRCVVTIYKIVREGDPVAVHSKAFDFVNNW